MKKEDLDALAGLYEGVYSPADNGEYLSEEYLKEQGGQRGSSSASQTNQSLSGAQLLYGPSGRPQAPSSRPTNLRGGGTRPARPSAAPTQSRFAGARDAAFSKARQIQGSPVVGPRPTEKPAGTTPAAATRPAATSPAARPAAPGAAKVAPSAVAKPAGQTGDKAKDMATWAKANPTLANKPKTPNPLMQKTFGYQTGNAPDQIKAASAGGDAQKAAASFARSRETANKLGMSGSLKSISSGYEWGSKATLKDVADAYKAVYEAKKKDQDQDGDNDFADVRIARMIASGMSRAEAIAAVRNKEYNEEVEILDEAEGSYGATPKAYGAASKTKMSAKRKPFLKKMLSRTNPANRTSPYDSPRKGMTDDDRERARAGSKHGVGTRQDHDYPSEGPGGVTKSAKKLRKQKAMGEFGETYEIDEATRMRKELGKEGETATRKELAARSKAYNRSGSVDRTIAAAERAADWSGDEKKAKTLRGLAASRRGSVRDKPRAGMRGYAAKVEGGDKELQSARQKAMSSGTLTPKEKKQLGEVYEIVASYLLENNFAETLNDANVIIENMSEVWLDEILAEKSGEQPLPYGRMMKKSDELADSDDKKKRKRAASIYLAANAPKGPKIKVR